MGVVSTVIFSTKKDRIWPALREASTPQMLRALYAAISLRFGKFLISDPGVSLFGILPLESWTLPMGRCKPRRVIALAERTEPAVTVKDWAEAARLRGRV